ncbi:hypothetical protein GCM10010169_47840 [Micromonospora fulviviridis]|nr:hypothetical protein GCM10010169_47840 [Micromonospora fulviviridis]
MGPSHGDVTDTGRAVSAVARGLDPQQGINVASACGDGNRTAGTHAAPNRRPGWDP